MIEYLTQVYKGVQVMALNLASIWIGKKQQIIQLIIQVDASK